MNSRIKICVNFIHNNKIIDIYSDKITNLYLLKKINIFIKLLIKYDIKLSYAYFQKSNYLDNYSIICYDKNIKLDIINNIYNNINDQNLKVFGYCNIIDKTINYISDEIRLKNKYNNTKWLISSNSFLQSNIEISDFLHDKINNIICKYKDINFYGLGGESGIYATVFKDYINKICLFTNSKYIYDDYIYNTSKINNMNLVDYKTLILKNYINTDNKKVLLVNISRKGLQNLGNQINNLSFKQIIYIGCSKKSIDTDANILTNYNIDNVYNINNIYLAIFNNKYI